MIKFFLSQHITSRYAFVWNSWIIQGGFDEKYVDPPPPSPSVCPWVLQCYPTVPWKSVASKGRSHQFHLHHQPGHRIPKRPTKTTANPSDENNCLCLIVRCVFLILYIYICYTQVISSFFLNQWCLDNSTLTWPDLAHTYRGPAKIKTKTIFNDRL